MYAGAVKREERRPTQLQRHHNRLRGQLHVQHPHELRTNVRQFPARKATLLFHVRYDTRKALGPLAQFLLSIVELRTRAG